MCNNVVHNAVVFWLQACWGCSQWVQPTDGDLQCCDRHYGGRLSGSSFCHKAGVSLVYLSSSTDHYMNYTGFQFQLLQSIFMTWFSSCQGIIERDEIVFRKVTHRQVPIVMLTSGGYQRSTAAVIADSIWNLSKKSLINMWSLQGGLQSFNRNIVCLCVCVCCL